jgi:hypothetical protein
VIPHCRCNVSIRQPKQCSAAAPATRRLCSPGAAPIG